MQHFESKNKYSIRSPLRYPGGKTRGVQLITPYFPDKLDTLLSPFFGGGSIELSIAAKGTKVLGYDVFSPLAEFWECLNEQPDQLANEVEKYFPLEKERFYALQKSQTNFTKKLQRAAVFYVLNRSSFSGATLSGGMSPGHPRFTESSIQRLRDHYNPNIKVVQADFETSLKKHTTVFAYLDPPYLISSSLYGKKGNAHKDFDHGKLAKMLVNREHWILSYNDCEEIRALYQGCKILMPEWKYGMSSNKASKEILIFSKDHSSTNA